MILARFRCPHCGYQTTQPASATVEHPCPNHPRRTVKIPRPVTTLEKAEA